jgi:CRP/FNR family cyclic AMP-dependent transcriptional regulator
MASRRVYIEHLRSVKLFDQLTRKDLERIATAGVQVSAPAGTVIAQQDTEGLDAYVVLEGSIDVRRNGRHMNTVGPGAIVGELSLLDKGLRTATATCATDCQLLVLSRGTFVAVIDDVPALSHRLLASMARRVRELDRRADG